MRFYSGLLRGALLSLSIPLFALPFSGGCATYSPDTTAEFPAGKAPELVLQPGDEVQILYTYWSDLDVAQAIRPDGKIALKMVGEVHAAGKSPAALREELLGLYADKLRDPDISVVVAGMGSQRVYVGGEVQRPGMVPIVGRMTLMEAVMAAGGPVARSAKLRQIVLVREQDGKRYAKAYDFREFFNESGVDAVELQPYDVVFIPRTTIDRIDTWVDQYINSIVPRNFTATYVWSNEVQTETQRVDSKNVNIGPYTPSISTTLPGN